jgi:TPR repeat protein
MKRQPRKEKAMSNDSEAMRLLKISANQGNADARFSLGLEYALKDDRESMRLIKLAARQGHIEARRFLESSAPRVAIAKWLYTRGWYPGGW